MAGDELQASVERQSTTNRSNIDIHLLTDRGQDVQSGNYSSDLGDADDFFSIYYSSTRFTAETVIAMTSAGINAAVLTTLVIVLTS